MKIKRYNDYIDELHEIYPKIDKNELKKVVRIFLDGITKMVTKNEDIVMKTKNFFLGIVSPRTKEAADKYAYCKDNVLRAYRKNRKINKQYEQQIKNNKHV